MDAATKAERSAQVHEEMRKRKKEEGAEVGEDDEEEEEEEDLVPVNGKLCYSHLQERPACRHQGHSRLRALYNRSTKLLLTLLRSSSIRFVVGFLVALVLRPTSIRILSSVFWWRFLRASSISFVVGFLEAILRTPSIRSLVSLPEQVVATTALRA
ncbi:unnamed protein product [Sphagnum compactum]